MGESSLDTEEPSCDVGPTVEGTAITRAPDCLVKAKGSRGCSKPCLPYLLCFPVRYYALEEEVLDSIPAEIV